MSIYTCLHTRGAARGWPGERAADLLLLRRRSSAPPLPSFPPSRPPRLPAAAATKAAFVSERRASRRPSTGHLARPRPPVQMSMNRRIVSLCFCISCPPRPPSKKKQSGRFAFFVLRPLDSLCFRLSGVFVRDATSIIHRFFFFFSRGQEVKERPLPSPPPPRLYKY